MYMCIYIYIYLHLYVYDIEYMVYGKKYMVEDRFQKRKGTYYGAQIKGSLIRNPNYPQGIETAMSRLKSNDSFEERTTPRHRAGDSSHC